VADHAQEAVAGLEQRGVEGAAAQVVDQPGAGAVVVGLPAGRQRRRDGLLQELDPVAALCGSSNSAGTDTTARSTAIPI
jgi:hypothetical protein